MSYKCRACNLNDVQQAGELCEYCATDQDPYAAALSQNMGMAQGGSQSAPARTATRKSPRILINGGTSAQVATRQNSSAAAQAPSTPVVKRGGHAPARVTTPAQAAPQAVAAQPAYLTSGITKNLYVDTHRRWVITKWFRSLFMGIPFSFENDITMFQVFPDYTGQTTNALGNACDQVVVYGKVNMGSVSENNDVEVFGHRDSKGNIVAKRIRNKATGTVVSPSGVIPVWGIWALTVIAIALLVFAYMAVGLQGFITAAIILFIVTHLPLIFKIIFSIIGFALLRNKR